MSITQRQLVDVSHTVEHGMITYKGLPAPIICDYLSREQSRQYYAGDTEFQIGKIEMVANRVYLLTPANIEVSAEDRERIAGGAFYNQF